MERDLSSPWQNGMSKCRVTVSLEKDGCVNLEGYDNCVIILLEIYALLQSMHDHHLLEFLYLYLSCLKILNQSGDCESF